VPKAAAETAVQLYFGMRDQQIEAEIARDKELEIDSAVELKTVWGSEYKGNSNLAIAVRRGSRRPACSTPG
jgi:hypothetical protein